MHPQGRQFCQNYFASLFEGVYSKRKEFASTRSKFLSFRVDPFSEENLYAELASSLGKMVENVAGFSMPVKHKFRFVLLFCFLAINST